MDKGAWQAIGHGLSRARHHLATKPPPHHQGNDRGTINISPNNRNDKVIEFGGKVEFS